MAPWEPFGPAWHFLTSQFQMFWINMRIIIIIIIVIINVVIIIKMIMTSATPEPAGYRRVESPVKWTPLSTPDRTPYRNVGCIVVIICGQSLQWIYSYEQTKSFKLEESNVILRHENIFIQSDSVRQKVLRQLNTDHEKYGKEVQNV